jgi:glycosyltransferase involved in cell wall biosynthesis
MEYFAELPSLKAKPLKRALWRGLERWGATGARGAAAVATVCDSIAEHLRADFAKPHVATVRNVPWRSDATDRGLLHARCGLPPTTPVALYQGMLQEGRGLEASVEALALVPGLHLAVIGDGPLREPLRRRAAALGCGERLHLLGEVPFRDLAGLTPGALVGLAPFQPLSPSYLYSLPGTPFEYVQAGVPVLATDLPEIRRVVEEYGVGWCVPGFSAEALAMRLRDLLADPARREALRPGLERARRELCWEEEERIYLSLYAK